jgi:hypothetical protein
VLPEGPYADGAEDNPYIDHLEGNQTVLAHLVGAAMFEGMLWKRAWRRVLIAAGAEENDDGKWLAGWIQTLQRIKFRKARGIEKRIEEHAAGSSDMRKDDPGTLVASSQSITDTVEESRRVHTQQE